ncbi:MAG TPA: 4-hydroxyphenylacetate 3-hydroxylase N-terminal domain-containing protein [Acetobacteraceae bacterium]|nr:4-hydroxyphenylacetate 3-hydroxylase N-terminal domain-containing protein [Acetobacteraceae bacterium]
MGIRTGAAYLASLRDDREIWIDGERVRDVTADRRFASAAQSVAALYDMQHEPVLRDRMSYASPSSGEPVGLSFIQAASADDLIRRREMGKLWADATCGMLGRSPDYMNIMLTGFASAHRAFGEKEPRFADNVRNYYLHVREHDLTMTHTLLNPQVDRSRPVEQQSKDLAAKIVRETDAGIVIHGARMVSTLAAFSNEIMVMPSTYLANSPEAAPYAFGFSIPVASPGLRFIHRPSVTHLEAASPMDFPLSLRFDEADAMAVFDDVLVPWERVFIHRDANMCNGLYDRTGAMPQVMHQFSTKNLAKSEFMMGLAFAIAKSTNIDQHLHVQGMLAELIQFTEFCRACLRASEADAAPNLEGVFTPAAMPLWTVRMMFAKMFLRMCEIVQTLGAGGLVAVPSYAETRSAVWPDVESYFQAANADSKSRIKLFRLAFDAAVSSFSGRQQLYERYYSGDPVRLAGSLYNMYDRDSAITRIFRLLDDFEAHPPSGVA